MPPFSPEQQAGDVDLGVSGPWVVVEAKIVHGRGKPRREDNEPWGTILLWAKDKKPAEVTRKG